MIKRRDDCRLCHSKNLNLVLRLEPSALANEFVKDPSIKQEVFPLDLFQCICGHFQILDVVDPGVMFKNYVYVSGTSSLIRKHFRNYACDIVSYLNLPENELIIDIGSNDGTLLKTFKALGMNVIGVEPADNIAKLANERGIKTVNSFFDRTVAKVIKEQNGTAAVICANNVFAHADNLDEIVLGVKELLHENGVFIFECSYFSDVLKCGDFSQIYHEHLSYHTINPLYTFFNRHNMFIFKIDNVDMHGGSIRCYVSNGPDGDANDALMFAEREGKLGIYSKDTWSIKNKFVSQVIKLKNELKTLLLQLKSEGKTIAAVTASAKSTTFLYNCELGPDIIDYICDDAPEKQNLYSPGKHIPIVPFSTIYEKNPDYLLMLSFNFVDFIINNHKNYNGKWIIPLPEYKELSYSDLEKV